MNPSHVILLLLALTGHITGFAQLPKAIPGTSSAASGAVSPDTTGASFDQAIAAQAKGDQAATSQAIQTSVATLEAEAKTNTGNFKDKLLGQAGSLKKLLPLAQSGMLQGNVLTKAMGLAKLAFGGSKLETLLGGTSLLGKAGALTGNLNLLKGGLSALGGPAQATGGGLINGALGSVAQLSSGGAAAETGVRNQVGGVLNFLKGAL